MQSEAVTFPPSRPFPCLAIPILIYALKCPVKPFLRPSELCGQTHPEKDKTAQNGNMKAYGVKKKNIPPRAFSEKKKLRTACVFKMGV